MCLILSVKNKFGKPLIATEDICCYKFVDVLHDGSLRTPYQLVPVKIGSTYESDFSFDEDGDIEKGLHSLVSLKAAIKEANEICDSAICRCVIPKGSRYYKGKFGLYHSRLSFASDRLTYVERIKEIS